MVVAVPKKLKPTATSSGGRGRACGPRTWAAASRDSWPTSHSQGAIHKPWTAMQVAWAIRVYRARRQKDQAP